MMIYIILFLIMLFIHSVDQVLLFIYLPLVRYQFFASGIQHKSGIQYSQVFARKTVDSTFANRTVQLQYGCADRGFG